MGRPTRLPRRAVAVVASHALAAVGMSLPWPMLLLVVEQATQSDVVLGLVAALRLLPYVTLSWLSGRLADRRERARIVRWSLLARVVSLGVAAAALGAGAWPLAVLGCTAAVVAGTPAYPALAAGMPRLAGPATARATGLLVTAEVASFVVGPAVGGLLLERWSPSMIALTGAALVLGAWPCFGRTVLPAPERDCLGAAPSGNVLRLVRGNRLAVQALVVVAAINAVLGAVSLALLPLAEQVWGSGPAGFGLATACLGFGSLAAPLLAHTKALSGARGGLVGMGVMVAASVVAPWGVAVLAALALVGALAVCCETVATRMLQEAMPDHLRASALGLADSVMVGSAMLATATAPALATGLGPVSFGVAVAAGGIALGAGLRPAIALRSAQPG